jgi:hypothetical protein
MRHAVSWFSRGLTAGACALGLAGALPARAGPTFQYPLSTTILVEAFAVNSYIQQGVSRNSDGNAPMSDAVSEIFGLSFADASASVSATGLRAAASVFNAPSGGYTASARASAGLVNPFIIVPQAGFTGTQALVRLAYHFGGSFNDEPGDCSTCFGSVNASLGVDGMTEQFYFLGAHSLGTINNPTYVAGGVNLGGVLEGLLPVNTELYLRAGLTTGVHCQSNALQSCSASALFGGTLGYDGSSPDAVDFVWSLEPQLAPPVPEPASWALMAMGLLGLTARRLRLRCAA